MATRRGPTAFSRKGTDYILTRGAPDGSFGRFGQGPDHTHRTVHTPRTAHRTSQTTYHTPRDHFTPRTPHTTQLTRAKWLSSSRTPTRRARAIISCSGKRFPNLPRGRSTFSATNQRSSRGWTSCGGSTFGSWAPTNTRGEPGEPTPSPHRPATPRTLVMASKHRRSGPKSTGCTEAPRARWSASCSSDRMISGRGSLFTSLRRLTTPTFSSRSGSVSCSYP